MDGGKEGRGGREFVIPRLKSGESGNSIRTMRRKNERETDKTYWQTDREIERVGDSSDRDRNKRERETLTQMRERQKDMEVGREIYNRTNLLIPRLRDNLWENGQCLRIREIRSVW
jgi:hypothetical protein